MADASVMAVAPTHAVEPELETAPSAGTTGASAHPTAEVQSQASPAATTSPASDKTEPDSVAVQPIAGDEAPSEVDEDEPIPASELEATSTADLSQAREKKPESEVDGAQVRDRHRVNGSVNGHHMAPTAQHPHGHWRPWIFMVRARAQAAAAEAPTARVACAWGLPRAVRMWCCGWSGPVGRLAPIAGACQPRPGRWIAGVAGGALWDLALVRHHRRPTDRCEATKCQALLVNAWMNTASKGATARRDAIAARMSKFNDTSRPRAADIGGAAEEGKPQHLRPHPGGNACRAGFHCQPFSRAHIRAAPAHSFRHAPREKRMGTGVREGHDARAGRARCRRKQWRRKTHGTMSGLHTCASCGRTTGVRTLEPTL